MYNQMIERRQLKTELFICLSITYYLYNCLEKPNLNCFRCLIEIKYTLEYTTFKYTN